LAREILICRVIKYKKGNALRKSLLRPIYTLLVVFACSFLFACGGGDSQTRVRVVNAIIDSSLLDVSLDGRLIGSYSFRQTSADYAQNDGVISLKFALANNSTALFTDSTNYEKGKRYTQVALGKVISGTPSGISLLTLIDNNNAAASSNFKLRFAHAAPDLAAIDVYITPDGRDFASDTARFSLAFKAVAPTNSNNALELANGKYRLRLTLSGTKTIVFDSGSLTEVSGADLQYIILPSDNVTGASAATVLSIPSIGTAKEVIDSRTAFRFANFASATAFGGNYDVYVRDVTEAIGTSNLVFSATQAATASLRRDIQAGAKRLTLTQPGNTAEVLGFDVALVAGKRQTAYLVGNASNSSGLQALKLIVSTDESSSTLIGQSKVRLLNADPSSTARDLVTLSSNGTAVSTIASRLGTGVAYLNSTTNQYQIVPSGTYQIATVPTTLSAPLLPDSLGVTTMFSPQRSYSVIQTAPPSLLLILSDD
jgi:Domain of unknown function (DUF4397)